MDIKEFLYVNCCRIILKLLTAPNVLRHVKFFRSVNSCLSQFSVRLQTSPCPGPVLPGGHVFLDVLRGIVPAYPTGSHVPYRVQSDAVSALDRLGHTSAVGIHVRGSPDRYSR